jgi:hypothetical protein
MDEIATQLVKCWDYFARAVGADTLWVMTNPENGYKIGLIAIFLIFGNGFLIFCHKD